MEVINIENIDRVITSNNGFSLEIGNIEMGNFNIILISNGTGEAIALSKNSNAILIYNDLGLIKQGAFEDIFDKSELKFLTVVGRF